MISHNANNFSDSRKFTDLVPFIPCRVPSYSRIFVSYFHGNFSISTLWAWSYRLWQLFLLASFHTPWIHLLSIFPEYFRNGFKPRFCQKTQWQIFLFQKRDQTLTLILWKSSRHKNQKTLIMPVGFSSSWLFSFSRGHESQDFYQRRRTDHDSCLGPKSGWWYFSVKSEADVFFTPFSSQGKNFRFFDVLPNRLKIGQDFITFLSQGLWKFSPTSRSPTFFRFRVWFCWSSVFFYSKNSHKNSKILKSFQFYFVLSLALVR